MAISSVRPVVVGAPQRSVAPARTAVAQQAPTHSKAANIAMGTSFGGMILGLGAIVAGVATKRAPIFNLGLIGGMLSMMVTVALAMAEEKLPKKAATP